MKVAFDIDDTLYKIVKDEDHRIKGVGAMCACGLHVKQELDHDMSQIVESLLESGHEVILWSAGGVEYVNDFIRRFRPAWQYKVTVLPKESGHNIDVCFDDQEVDLAKTVLRIKREHADHWQEFLPGRSKGV